MENSITLRAVKAAIAILSVTTCFGAAARAAGAFDATGDFSIASNPNGVWSYLESTTLFSLSKTEAGGGIQFWNSGLPEPNYISIYKNITSAPIAISTIVAQPGTLVMDPESQTVTVAFTAPTTGKYDVSGTFTGADTNENSHAVSIVSAGAAIWQNTIQTYQQSDPFNLTLSLTKGTTVDFTVGTGHSGAAECPYCDLSTGFEAVISGTSVAKAPELSPESTFTGITFLLGTLVLVQSRRTQRETL
jgi:hypothetical protein